MAAFADQGERLVGQFARRQAILNPKGTIYSARRFTGRRYDEVASEMNAVSYHVVAGPDGAVRFAVRGREAYSGLWPSPVLTGVAAGQSLIKSLKSIL